MPAKSKSSGNAPAKPRNPEPPAGGDAIGLLEADHREVDELFSAFDDAASDADKRAIANAICCALKVHAQIEEELFYPAALGATEAADLLKEATVEHCSARDLIAQIEAGAPGEPLFDARVVVLGEYVRHHVEEEEDILFPLCRESGMDLSALGQALLVRKQELTRGLLVSNPVNAPAPASMAGTN
jgi:hemerythrin-like domain-containing protein